MDKFSSKHFAFLMLAVGIVSIKTYPIVFMKESGRDSWVAFILASALIFVFFLFAVNTMKPVKDFTLLKVYQTAFGRVLGGIFIVLFAFCLLLTLIESAAVEADSMHQNMLVETPNWYFLIFFVLPAFYIVRKDTVAVVIISVIGISLIIAAGIHLGILTTQQKEVKYLFPIFEEGITSNFWISMLKSLGLYGFLSITLPYIPLIQYKRDTLTKASVIALIFLVQMLIVAVTGVFMTFPVETAVSYYYPKLVQTNLVSYFEMLEFGELYVMLQILGGWLLKYLVTFHSFILVMRSFKIKDRVIYITSFAVTGVVSAAAYFVTYTSVRLFAALNYLPWIALANFVIIPTIAFIICRIRQRSIKQA